MVSRGGLWRVCGLPAAAARAAGSSFIGRAGSLVKLIVGLLELFRRLSQLCLLYFQHSLNLPKLLGGTDVVRVPRVVRRIGRWE